MYVICNKCGKFYDDEFKWTICPHYPLEVKHDGSNFCFRHDLFLPCQGCEIESKNKKELTNA